MTIELSREELRYCKEQDLKAYTRLTRELELGLRSVYELAESGNEMARLIRQLAYTLEYLSIPIIVLGRDKSIHPGYATEKLNLAVLSAERILECVKDMLKEEEDDNV